jgi:hypothetical protein
VSRYRPRKSEDSEESDEDSIIPVGQPYLTKVNGKLVMAREKKPKAANIAADLLREAFGVRTVIRRRSKSLERPKAVPLLHAGTPYYQQLQLPYSTPLPQQPFAQPLLQYQPYNPRQQGCPQSFISYQLPICNPNMIQTPQYTRCPQQPQHYTVQQSKPSQEDFESLKRIDAHYNELISKKTKRLSAGPESDSSVQDITNKATITTANDIRANCGRLRSRRYHAENPIKSREIPTTAFCRKCQRDSSETSDLDSAQSLKNTEHKKGKRDKRKKVRD